MWKCLVGSVWLQGTRGGFPGCPPTLRLLFFPWLPAGQRGGNSPSVIWVSLFLPSSHKKPTTTCWKALWLPVVWLTELVLNYYRWFNPMWCRKYTPKCQHHRWQPPSPGWLHGSPLDVLFFQVVSGNNSVGSVLLSVKHQHRQLSAGSW